MGKILRSRLSDAGLNRGQLAARLEVSETTVDNWMDGGNWPGREYTDVLALEFAGGDSGLAASLAKGLRRDFALARLCHMLAEQVGREAVIFAVNAVSRFAQDLSNRVGPLFIPEEEWRTHAMWLLQDGGDHPSAPDILRMLAAGYPDGERREVVLKAAAPWRLAFGLALRDHGGSKSSAAGLAQDYLEVVDAKDWSDALLRRVYIQDMGGSAALLPMSADFLRCPPWMGLSSVVLFAGLSPRPSCSLSLRR